MNAHEKPLEHLRSPHWPKVRAEHLQQHPVCEVCAATEKLNVHHILPFHLHPDLELNPKNLITLCEDEAYVSCHLWFGHLGNFHGFNPDVVKDAADWHRKFEANKERIHESAAKEETA